MDANDQPKIRVVIRKRPLNKKQMGRNEQDVVEVEDRQQVKVREHKFKVDLTKYIEEHSFKFDSAFGEEVSNPELYQNCVRPIVQCAFLGAKVTCFAYGQTGSGKTYTMNGDLDGNCPGIYYLGAEDIFAIRDSSYDDLTIAVSFYEIYCGKLFDLLNGREQLQAREDGKQNVNIVGLTVKPINNTLEFMETIAAGSSVRITSQNSTNADSSRSHAILQISLMTAKKKIHGKISFIDLAGCERGADTIDQNKQTKIDGAEINKSLLALKECIRALDQGKNHTPFRGSKLTMVLKDSFTGFCKTVMIGNVSPGSASCENTLNTLRYADRVKELKKGGNNGSGESKDEQLARELMLPRTQKNKQIIIKNEDDSDEEIIIKPCEPKPNPIARPITAQKKTKYIQSCKIEEESEDQYPNAKKKPQNGRKDPVPRKGVMNNQNDHANARSVAHSNITASFKPNKDKEQRPQNRNKSLVSKLNLKGMQRDSYQIPNKKQNESATERQRKNLSQNYSAANLQQKYWEVMEESQKFKGSFCNDSGPRKGTRFGHVNPDNKENGFKGFAKVKTDASEQKKCYGGEWEGIVKKFKYWKGNSDQFAEMSSLFEELVKQIIKEELELSEQHKKMLINEEKGLQESLGLYNQSQNQTKNNAEMLQYTSRVHCQLSTRIRAMVEMQARLQMYQSHLKEHQMCENKLLEASSTLLGVECVEEGLWDQE